VSSFGLLVILATIRGSVMTHGSRLTKDNELSEGNNFPGNDFISYLLVLLLDRAHMNEYLQDACMIVLSRYNLNPEFSWLKT